MILDAPQPWGPWTVAYEVDNWDVGPGEHGDFPAKWISRDGRTVHLVFSGDDCFSVRRAEHSSPRVSGLICVFMRYRGRSRAMMVRWPAWISSKIRPGKQGSRSSSGRSKSPMVIRSVLLLREIVTGYFRNQSGIPCDIALVSSRVTRSALIVTCLAGFESRGGCGAPWWWRTE